MKEIKISIVNGSPKGSKGATYKMLKVLMELAEERSYEVNYIELAAKHITYCRGCYGCWLKTPGKCVILDDMNALLKSIRQSDYIFYASPLYVDNITGLMKNFFDRSIPMANPRFEKDKNGEALHFRRYPNEKTPKVVVISNCSFPENSHFDVLRLLFKRMARNMRTEVVAEIYRTQGPMLKSENILIKMLLAKYYSNLRKAYMEIFDSGKISVLTQKKISEPLVPIDSYYRKANEICVKEEVKAKARRKASESND